jgi:N-methylhydantoinase B
LEIFESRYPVLFARYAIRDGSGGPGMRRGGLGVIFEFEIRRGEASASMLGDRGRFAPFGVLGGKAAKSAKHTFRLSGEEYHPPHISKDEGIPMQPGDLLTLETPGGGGYGNPLDRSVHLVLRDVRRGYYSREVAECEYGVLIKKDDWEVDHEGTARLRALRRSQ